eukprot:CAMPEP_0174718714 /NCGR_PEP_ID=MMETSP1094-20130205/29803_1 /TAXON_ID=156173 /ORGANISM="Chrysochromulina brevifilum, Strain UTEX LB 985" /LENGTH=265 /DNA_ID=CAMNT_0015918887 /DNA_START=97 /DNA_END=891 /DNA_ORIENTATION=-
MRRKRQVGRRWDHEEGSTSHSRPLETNAEVAIGNYLQPFQLSDMLEVVHTITGAGYSSPAALRALDDVQLQRLGVSEQDSHRILLASWLDTLGLIHYGPHLLAAGCNSLLELLALSDEKLANAGVPAIGHRRQIQRALREDELVQAMAAAQREQQAAEKRVRMRQRGPQQGHRRRATGPTTDDLHFAGTVKAELDVTRGGLRELPGSVGRSGRQHDAWSDAWRTTGNASLGTAPGETEQYRPASVAWEGGVQVMRSNGEPAMTVW